MAEDIDADSKTNKKTPLLLHDLPIDVFQIVTGKLPLTDCLALRKVSQDLRRIVDSSEMYCKTIDFEFEPEWRMMKLDNVRLIYEPMGDKEYFVTRERQVTKTMKMFLLKNRSSSQAFIADAATFLRNPKLEIDQIGITCSQADMWNEFFEFLRTLNHSLNVKSIRSKDLEILQAVEGLMNSEKLQEILCNGIDKVEKLNKVTNPEILKNPKLKFEKMIFDYYKNETAAKFLKILQSPNHQLNIQSIHIRDGKWIPSILQSLNPEKVGEVIIKRYCWLTIDQFNELARSEQWKRKTRLVRFEIPQEIGLEELKDFKEIRSNEFEITEENLIKIRDVLLKSPYLDSLKLENIGSFEDEMNERIDRIMGEDPSYNASNCRFSLPDSTDYFQLKFEKSETEMVLNIERIGSK